MEAALSSPYAIEKLLNRLKQSIYAAREFSGFAKERCALEDRYAQGYKKLVRHASESLRKPESRQGSYARNFDETLRVNERTAENTLQLALSLQTMSEELREVAETAERGRKHWKHATIDAEKRLSDAESAQAKAKDRYNSAAEQYDRVRTGEKQGGKFGLKNKTPAQQEEALKEKADMLDQDYAQKSQAAQEQRREFEGSTKPSIIRNLQDLIKECDAALSMQMAKLASLSEKHIVSIGMAVAPIRNPDSTGPEPRGLRQIAQEIDDDRDFQDYMLDGVEPPPQFKGRSRRNTDAEPMTTPVQQSTNFDTRRSSETPYYGSPAHVESQPPQLPQIGGQDSFGNSFELQRPSAQKRDSSFIGGQPDTLSKVNTDHRQQTGIIQDSAPAYSSGQNLSTGPPVPPYERTQAPVKTGGYDGVHQRQDSLGSANVDHTPVLLRQDMPTSSPQYDQGPVPSNARTADLGHGQLSNSTPGSYLGRGGPAPGSYMDPGKNFSSSPITGAGRGQLPSAQRNLPSQQPQRPMLPPNKPVFGMHLDDLFRRDGTAVPAIVFQCIQAVDTFGLNTEGIYRISGSAPTVTQLKSEFDHDSSLVKLTEPASFNNDIASVATLLKNFLRDLPDALMTNTAYHSFIQAAKYEDTIMRRDALHQYINSLPDPNYATLRVLVLHLHRVSRNSDVNKMDMRNLAIVFGPTILGGNNVADAGYHTKVMETILHHTHDIFDPDE
ncbi:Rho GTPase-activating protein [Lithohypha guttulata]|nr:Rho GTPase-activating protein [Lithohypha guttulata]